MLVTGLSEVVVPNNGVVVVVEPNEIVTFSLEVAVDVVPNVEKETDALVVVVADAVETSATTIFVGEVKLAVVFDTAGS